MAILKVIATLLPKNFRKSGHISCSSGGKLGRCPLSERIHMLVLSRRLQEELVIDERIRVVVLGIQGQRVRLGISAPDDVEIRRAEIEIVLAADCSSPAMNGAEEHAYARA